MIKLTHRKTIHRLAELKAQKLFIEKQREWQESIKLAETRADNAESFYRNENIKRDRAHQKKSNDIEKRRIENNLECQRMIIATNDACDSMSRKVREKLDSAILRNKNVQKIEKEISEKSIKFLELINFSSDNAKRANHEAFLAQTELRKLPELRN